MYVHLYRFPFRSSETNHKEKLLSSFIASLRRILASHNHIIVLCFIEIEISCRYKGSVKLSVREKERERETDFNNECNYQAFAEKTAFAA